MFSVKKVLRMRGIDTKVGHLGTLDPLASGVLPIALGRATRLFDFSLAKTKTYLAAFKFGYTCETLDICSELIPFDGEKVTKEKIERVLPTFIGRQNQIPPQYSAKNIQGERAYKKARKGEVFELPAKEIEIFACNLLEQTEEDTFTFQIVCSSGTYIRSVARDLGKALGTEAVMSSLCRTASGKFTLENSISEEELLSRADSFEEYILPMDFLLSDLPSVTLSEQETFRIENGIAMPVPCEVPCKIYTRNGVLLGLGDKNENGLFVKTRLL